jgi:hypothetical protein
LDDESEVYQQGSAHCDILRKLNVKRREIGETNKGHTRLAFLHHKVFHSPSWNSAVLPFFVSVFLLIFQLKTLSLFSFFLTEAMKKETFQKRENDRELGFVSELSLKKKRFTFRTKLKGKTNKQ